ncbi:MAG: type IX secretion system protein PorQ [Bacteroidales bacterium]|mgnify:FL=1|jgi:hypothetical protein|nr:type IX secretion system protein PorQ [Bacteroidales bacterium]MDD4045075.1 type IX secretion system protein PorQ [Bacteroidales bacterium]MDX9889985.1 type IX secretion system protein PorQ [Bacteroidales bacterium]NLO41910.1 type IX secretion system protein PorQ [Bacteroidales bacterium]
MRKVVLLVLTLVASVIAYAQTGGVSVYNFLNLPVSARVAAMGNKLLAVKDQDPSLLIMNPSLIRKEMNQGVSINCVDYFADAAFGHINYVHDFKKAGTFNFAFQFVSYGKFQGYDECGNETGSFTAGDYALIGGYAKDLVDSVLSMGMNVKWIFSSYESYFSTGLAVDVAATYYNKKHDLCLSLLASNIGAQIKGYTNQKEKLPFDLQLAFSQKMKHAPFRYNICLHHLYTWNMNYLDPTNPFLQIDAVTGTFKEKTNFQQFANNLFRHFVIGIEILPAKYLSLQFAYNYNTRQEMKAFERTGFVGFSYGLSIHIYNIKVQYARAHNNLASTPNYFTFSTLISKFLK